VIEKMKGASEVKDRILWAFAVRFSPRLSDGGTLLVDTHSKRSRDHRVKATCNRRDADLGAVPAESQVRRRLLVSYRTPQLSRRRRMDTTRKRRKYKKPHSVPSSCPSRASSQRDTPAVAPSRSSASTESLSSSSHLGGQSQTDQPEVGGSRTNIGGQEHVAFIVEPSESVRLSLGATTSPPSLTMGTDRCRKRSELTAAVLEVSRTA
jgi:hypothetical protein